MNMKQVIYNGDMGPYITAGGIPFTAGESVAVEDDTLAGELLAKPNFGEAPARAMGMQSTSTKVTPEPVPTPAP